MISKALKKVVLGAAAVLSVGAATLATTADAAPWHGGYGGGYHGGGYYHGGYRGGYGPGVAIGAGLLGVAIGESLAHPYYGAPPAYYDGCRTYYRWDPHWGRYVRVERCY